MNRAARLALVPLALTATLGSAACGAEPPPEPASATEPLAGQREPVLVEPGDRAGASRAELEGAAPLPEAGGPTTAAAPGNAAEAVRPLVRLTTLTDVVAEDGAGGRAPAPRAIGIDLDARRFPPRALDPVLHVGTLVLRRYEHPRVGTLRFVLAETAAPPEGAPMFAQYGDDAASRVELGPFSRDVIAAESP